MKTVASGTAYFLIIALYVAGHIVVHHPADIAFVNTHAESYCSTHHLSSTLEKTPHRFISAVSAHAGMVAHRTYALRAERLVEIFGTVARQTIGYA